MDGSGHPIPSHRPQRAPQNIQDSTGFEKLARLGDLKGISGLSLLSTTDSSSKSLSSGLMTQSLSGEYTQTMIPRFFRRKFATLTRLLSQDWQKQTQ